MVLEILSLIAGLVGFGWAGYKDLRTTEFPDWLPYSMILTAVILRGAFAFLESDITLIFNSLFIGSTFLGFGLLLYYTRQWGDGDAWLFGALGFLFPDGLGFPATLLPFPFTILMNFFVVAFVYIVMYSLVVGMRSKKSKKFMKTFKKDLPVIIVLTVVITAVFFGVFWGMGIVLRENITFAFPILLFLLLSFIHFGRFIEKEVFLRKIPARNLKEGDVPVDKRWRVLSKREIAALKRKGGSILLKEGVRFAPVFFLTILATSILGNLLTIIV